MGDASESNGLESLVGCLGRFGPHNDRQPFLRPMATVGDMSLNAKRQSKDLQVIERWYAKPPGTLIHQHRRRTPQQPRLHRGSSEDAKVGVPLRWAMIRAVIEEDSQLEWRMLWRARHHKLWARSLFRGV